MRARVLPPWDDVAGAKAPGMEDIVMIFVPKTKKPRLWIAAAALGLGMAFSAPAEARGFGGFHGGMGFHGGGMGFRGPVAFAHRGFAGSAFSHRAFVSRPFFFHRRFADDRRFFFHRHRFARRFAFGSYDAGYDYPYYDSGAYDDQCYVVRHRVLNRWGYVVVHRRLVCG
jgi:hypothetical protein